MSTFNPEDKEIQDLLRETPMGQTTPEDLKRRLRVMASGSKLRSQSRWAPRFAFMSAGLVVIAALTLMFWPATASAKSFQKVIDATNMIKTFRLAIRVLEGGKEENVIVQGGEGIVDVQAPEGTHVQFADNEIRVYEAKKNELNVVKLGGMFDEQMIERVVREGVNQGLGQLDVKKMLAQFKDEFGGQNAKVSDVFEQDGQMVYTVDLSSPKESERVKITVDADSDLPLRIQVNGEHEVDVRVEFGHAIDIQPMEKIVPKDAKRTEVDLSKMIQGGMEELGKGLQKGMNQGLKFNSKEFEKGMKEMERHLNGKEFNKNSKEYKEMKSIAEEIKNEIKSSMKK